MLLLLYTGPTYPLYDLASWEHPQSKATNSHLRSTDILKSRYKPSYVRRAQGRRVTSCKQGTKLVRGIKTYIEQIKLSVSAAFIISSHSSSILCLALDMLIGGYLGNWSRWGGRSHSRNHSHSLRLSSRLLSPRLVIASHHSHVIAIQTRRRYRLN